MLLKIFDARALVISILRLLPLIPTGVLINILSRRLENWWATRSQSALVRQINKLENNLVRWDGFPALTEVEDNIFIGIQGAIGCFGLVFCFLMVMEDPPFPLISASTISASQGFLLFIAVFGALFAMFIFMRIDRFQSPRSERMRQSTCRQIESLKKKLEAK